VRLANQFELDLPAERVWPALLDLPRVARALPGARVQPGADGAYRGEMTVRIGPVTIEYAGTVVLEEVDEDERFARLRVQARERRGQGSARATIVNRLRETPTGSRVEVETELDLTGRPAQFGRGMLEEVAGGVLADFAARLERDLAGGAGEARPEAHTAEALDLGSAVAGPLRERALLLGAGFAIGLLAGALVWRR
jgi:uncharacterized protein